MTELQESAQESPREFDVVERARQAVDAWDRFAAWAPTRVPGVRVCLDLVRDLLAEVERLRDDIRVEGLIRHQCESVDAEVERLRTDLARMTEQAEASILELRDVARELDAVHGDLAEARALIDRVRQAVIWADPKRMDGIPCVRNTRVPVDQITTLLAECTDAQIVKFYPTVRRTQVAVLRALDGEVSGE